MMSPVLARFFDRLRDFDPREEAYDTAELRTATVEDRDQAARALLMLLKQRQDPRAVMALADLGEVWVAPELRALAVGGAPIAAVARRALVRLGVIDEGSAAGLAEDTRHGTHFQRFGAVMELQKVPGREAHDALMSALGDDDALVRSQAYDALVARLGLVAVTRLADGSDVNLRAPLEVMHLLLRQDSPSLRTLGLVRLRRIFAAVEAGKTAAELGLDFVGEDGEDLRHAVGRALRTPTIDYPVERIRGASPHDRAFAEALWAVALGRGDVRAPAALAALGATWTIPTLEEARARGGEPAFVAAVETALASLTSGPTA